jgi:alginate O-acetyltransferase complex protein AlgI
MTISYLVEVYRSSCQKASLLEFATYLTLFPHLVAGPIVRFNEIANDLRQRNSLTINNFFEGIIRFTQGLGMKVLIADNLCPTVDRIFSLDQSALTFGASWLGALAYTFQIYYDFAGYSAMAIGLALMFGFHFPENFNRPYIAPSITDFWKRWHMSLSRWLRDYIYIPLGGNRKGNARTYINLFAVFFICGLWHGAAWTFVAWGIYQGLLLISERIIKNNFSFQVHGIVGIIATFTLTIIGWVLFRSESFAQCWCFLKAMFSFSGILDFVNLTNSISEYMDPLLMVCLTVAAFFSFSPFEWMNTKIRSNSKLFLLGKTTVAATILFLVSLYAVGNSFKPFIYFRF